jgi:D-lactate dehydrogenase
MELRPRVLVTTVNDADGRYLQETIGDLCDLKIVLDPVNNFCDLEKDDLDRVEILLPFIHPHIGRAEIDAMPRLKLIATRSTGYDHIDIAYAKECGVAVANVPGYGETAVAEYTFALLLTLSRKLHLAYTRTQQGNYALDGLQGFDLYGKTLGVVGAGAIGLHVIRIAKGFGMNVVATDVYQNRLLSEVLGFRYVTFDELLASADIVSLHAPALPETYHLINRQTLSAMKPGALLINTARGSLIDTEALAWALDTGILAGAGLDALEDEELLQHEEELLAASGAEAKLKTLLRHRLLQRRNNVVITPHNAFNSVEALRRILDTTIENVQAFLQGKPRNLVGGSTSNKK